MGSTSTSAPTDEQPLASEKESRHLCEMSHLRALEGPSLPWFIPSPRPKRNSGYRRKVFPLIKPGYDTETLELDGPNLGDFYDQRKTSNNRPSKRLKGQKRLLNVPQEHELSSVAQDTTFAKPRDGDEGCLCTSCATIPFSLLRTWFAEEPQVR